ncbi:MAG: hypothetical protein ABI178_14960 [Rhodanobacter sp.]
MMPAAVHHGQVPRITAQRAITLKGAFDRDPHRFKGRSPQAPRVPDTVYINPPMQDHLARWRKRKLTKLKSDVV